MSRTYINVQGLLVSIDRGMPQIRTRLNTGGHVNSKKTILNLALGYDAIQTLHILPIRRGRGGVVSYGVSLADEVRCNTRYLFA
jgi:hypothetical protein